MAFFFVCVLSSMFENASLSQIPSRLVGSQRATAYATPVREHFFCGSSMHMVTIQYDALHYIQYYTAHVFLSRKAKKNAKGKGTRVPLLSGWFDGCHAPRTSGFCCRFTALKVSSNVTQLSGFIARLFEVFCVGDVFYSSALTHLMYFS